MLCVLGKASMWTRSSPGSAAYPASPNTRYTTWMPASRQRDPLDAILLPAGMVQQLPWCDAKFSDSSPSRSEESHPQTGSAVQLQPIRPEMLGGVGAWLQCPGSLESASAQKCSSTEVQKCRRSCMRMLRSDSQRDDPRGGTRTRQV